MSGRHSSSRREAYGRRQKDLRARRAADLAIDLDGPSAWSRGSNWERSLALPPQAHQDEAQEGGRAR